MSNVTQLSAEESGWRFAQCFGDKVTPSPLSPHGRRSSSLHGRLLLLCTPPSPPTDTLPAVHRAKSRTSPKPTSSVSRPLPCLSPLARARQTCPVRTQSITLSDPHEASGSHAVTPHRPPAFPRLASSWWGGGRGGEAAELLRLALPHTHRRRRRTLRTARLPRMDSLTDPTNPPPNQPASSSTTRATTSRRATRAGASSCSSATRTRRAASTSSTPSSRATSPSLTTSSRSRLRKRSTRSGGASARTRPTSSCRLTVRSILLSLAA